MLPIFDLSQTLSSSTGLWRYGYRLILSMLIASVLVGCGNLDQYDITLNDRTLYTPRDLFEEYYLPDVALSNCVTQAIEDGQVFAVCLGEFNQQLAGLVTHEVNGSGVHNK